MSSIAAVLAFPHPVADFLVIAGLAAMGFVFGLKRSRYALVVLMVGIVYSTFFVRLGTKWSAQELVPVAIVVGLVAHSVIRRSVLDRLLKLPVSLVAVFVGLGVITFASALLSPASSGVSTRAITAEGRWIRSITQGASYGIQLLYFVIPICIGISSRTLKTAVRGLVLCVVGTGLYGIYQVVGQWGGLPFRPVVYDANYTAMGIISVNGVDLVRMSGLTNEPKQLAMLALIGLVTTIVSRDLFQSKSLKALCAGVCSIAFIGALSTGGLLAAFVLFAVWVLFAVMSVVRGRLRVRIFGQLGAVVAILTVSAIVYVGYSASPGQVIRRVALERVSLPMLTPGDEFRGARIEHAVLQRFGERPMDALTGLGVGQYPFQVGERGEWVGRRGVQPMHSLPLVLLADLGVVGLLVFVCAIGRILSRSAVNLRSDGGRVVNGSRGVYEGVVYGFVASLAAALFVHVLTLTLLFMGILTAHNRRLGLASRTSAWR